MKKNNFVCITCGRKVAKKKTKYCRRCCRLVDRHPLFGKKSSLETRKKMSLNANPWNKGKKLSLEHIKKLSQAKIGKPSNMKGKNHKEETKLKISLSKVGKPCNSSTKFKKGHVMEIGIRNKISESMKRFLKEKYEIKDISYSGKWTKEFRNLIRERDGFICKICGVKQATVALHIHHIDYDKSNCNLENLVTLCRICHLKTNHKRKYWIEYFKNYGKNKPI